MQRWTAFLFAALTAAFIAVVIVARRGGPVAGERGARGAADVGADAAPDAALAATALVDAGEAPDADMPENPVGSPSEPTTMGTTDAGTTLLSGEVAPALGADAPTSVVFGVILVQYKGAQAAPVNARSREAALELAKQLALEAKTDFKAAVAKGDKGSMENAGRMPRGMLESAPEYVLFSLRKDGVSDPVDTPRGFWIARRIE
jgi:hypothetical protein